MNSDTDCTPQKDDSISRRDFLQGSAVAAVAPMVLVRAAGAEEDSAETLKVGLVGCGGRGTGAAVQALRADEGAVLTALADVFPERTKGSLARIQRAMGGRAEAQVKVADDHCFAGFDAYQKLIDSGVDVVLMATPPHFRPDQLRAAIAAGKHVFCEKPMAVDAPGVRSVLETAKLADEKRVSLVSGFCWRYNVRHRETYRRIHEGQIGEIRAIYSTYNASPLEQYPRKPEWSDMEWQLRNWKHFCWSGGDHIVEQAVHSLDKQGWTMQDEPPIRCTAVGGRQAREGLESGNIYDHFGVCFEYEGGVQAFHMCRQIANCSNDNSDYVWGTKGTCTINGWAQRNEITGESPWRYEGPGNDMYQTEHDELFAAIRAGEPKNDGIWMARSTMLAVIARMATYTGKTITWKDALASEERLGPTTYEWGDLPFNPVPVPGKTRFA